MLILDLTKADACELAATRLAHLAKHGAGGYILYTVYRASAQRSRLIPLCFYAMMNVDYTSLYYVIADACASKISISFSHLT